MEKTLIHVETADSLWAKTLGVIGKKNFGSNAGLLLTGTNAIHTFFVRFPLDLVFLGEDYKVVKLVKNLKPWSFSPIVWAAKHTLEMPSGSIDKHNLAVGDTLQLK